MSDIGGEGVQEGDAFEYLIRRGIQRKGEWRVEGGWFVEEGENGKERSGCLRVRWGVGIYCW